MTVIVDTREHPDRIRHIVQAFERRGVVHHRSKLVVGDYQSLDRPRFAIDRKADLLELAYNACQDHARFLREIALAARLGIDLVFLCEHGDGMRSLPDVARWENPRLRESKLALSGPRLARILACIQGKYGVRFQFCDPSGAGDAIIDLLR